MFSSQQPRRPHLSLINGVRVEYFFETYFEKLYRALPLLFFKFHESIPI